MTDRLQLLLIYAALRARVMSRTVHVYRDGDDLIWSDFIPRLGYRNEWLKVGPSGDISDGSGRRLGTASDVLAQH